MSTNADRDNFENEFVAKYNENNPDDPILGTATNEEIEKWKARLWPDESAKKRRPKTKEGPQPKVQPLAQFIYRGCAALIEL